MRVFLQHLQPANPHKYRQNERPAIQNRRPFGGASVLTAFTEKLSKINGFRAVI